MDPITIAAGISALGSLFSGVTGFLGGNAKADALKKQAAQHRAEAGVNAQAELEQGNATVAHAAVQAAANGGGFVGSTMGVLQDLSRKAMFNARSAAYRGATQSQADEYAADQAGSEALQSLVSGGLGAGASMFSGMGKSAALSRMAGAGAGAGAGAAAGGADLSELAGLF